MIASNRVIKTMNLEELRAEQLKLDRRVVTMTIVGIFSIMIVASITVVIVGFAGLSRVVGCM